MENTQSILWEKFDFSFGVHLDIDVIWIKFPNDRVLLKFLKTQAKVFSHLLINVGRLWTKMFTEVGLV